MFFLNLRKVHSINIYYCKINIYKYIWNGFIFNIHTLFNFTISRSTLPKKHIHLMYFPPSIRIHLQIPQEQNNPIFPFGCLGCRHSAISFPHGEAVKLRGWFLVASLRCNRWWLMLHVIILHPRNLTWPLKNDGWKMSFLLGLRIFRGYVKFQGCILKVEMIVGLPFWKRVPSSGFENSKPPT